MRDFMRLLRSFCLLWLSLGGGVGLDVALALNPKP